MPVSGMLLENMGTYIYIYLTAGWCVVPFFKYIYIYTIRANTHIFLKNGTTHHPAVKCSLKNNWTPSMDFLMAIILYTAFY